MENTVENLLKRKRMLVVIIVVLAFLCLALFFYGLINKIEGNKNLELVNHKMEELEQCKKESERQTIIAEMNAMEAQRQNERAEEALKKLSKK